MALTATVSPAMKAAIMQSLSMCPDDTMVIERLLNKPNIRYTVCVTLKDVEERVSPVITHFAERGKHAKKTIIFRRTYGDFNEISTFIISALYDRGLTHLLTPDKPVCQMFSSSTEEKVKTEIFSSFTDPQSVIVAMIAFGMGLDVSSDSIEAYLQETGRCGRDGCDFFATLYYRKQDVASNSLVSGSESGRECVSLTNVTAPVHGHGRHNFFC